MGNAAAVPHHHPPPTVIRVAYFRDPMKLAKERKRGLPPKGTAVLAALAADKRVQVEHVGAAEIRAGALRGDGEDNSNGGSDAGGGGFDVLLVPGGFAPHYEEALGAAGAAAVRAFVAGGGGYVGICAGAYLGCAGWLELLPDVAVVDIENWARGRSDDCVLRVGGGAGAGNGGGTELIARYCNGPLLGVRAGGGGPGGGGGSSSGAGSVEVAGFASDFCGKRGRLPTLPRGVMPQHSAVVAGTHGAGRVVLISPHLEDGEPAARAALLGCVLHTAPAGGRPAAAAAAAVPLPQPQLLQGTEELARQSWLATRKKRYSDAATTHDANCALARLRREAGARRQDGAEAGGSAAAAAGAPSSRRPSTAQLIARLALLPPPTPQPDVLPPGAEPAAAHSPAPEADEGGGDAPAAEAATAASRADEQQPTAMFVYGSLRPDDDSGMPWTRDFIAGFDCAVRGSVGGARMFVDGYASVALDADAGAEERVHGFALCFDESCERWLAKLREADHIEGFDERDMQGSLYQRTTVTVQLAPEAGGGTCRAYMFHRPSCSRRVRIPSGDWLQRPRPRKASASTKKATSAAVVSRGTRRAASARLKRGVVLPVGSSASGAANRRRTGASVLPPAEDGYSDPSGRSPIVAHLRGPILLTAPHGLRLFRGGKEHGERRRVHQREKWSTELVLKLAGRVSELLGVPCSFVVWNMKTAAKLTASNSDPNYMLERQFGASPWHAQLRRFRDRCRAAGVPCMHVDLHGKRNPKAGAKAYSLDLGIDPLTDCAADKAVTGAEALLWSEAETGALKEAALHELRGAFAGVRVGRSTNGPQLPVKVEGDPYLCGLWGHGCEHTLSHQSVRLGVPAFQFEMPHALRRSAMQDDELVDRMAAAIVAIYRTSVVPIEGAKGCAAPPGGLLAPGQSAAATRDTTERMLCDIAVLDAMDPDPQI